MRRQRALGARPDQHGCHFRVWAPAAQRVEVVCELSSGVAAHSLEKHEDGTFDAFIEGVRAGDRYRYRVDGHGPYPDPASRFQPDGVHGPSEVIDASRYSWSDGEWRGFGLDELVIYEMHVGTFTPAGTFLGAIERLPNLVDLGVSAVELMPVADFPGERNWGYDGVSLFAPARCYGRPDDLRRLVDEAHRLGLAVLLDVVYNHLGPDGNYLGVYSSDYFSDRHQTAWGAGLNFDGRCSEQVREFFFENALHWFHEYHVDGLRLDATHAILDDSTRHFLAELSSRVRESITHRKVVLIAEDHRNLAHMLKEELEGGWVIDAVWADSFHHQMRRLLVGENEGYYRDFTGTTEDLATTIRKGWFYCGQFSEYLGEPRGTDPAGLRHSQFVYCLQNHDQIGNRALGERLHHQTEPAEYRAATAVLLCSPATPLLFMGQEWAASTPFLFFTDHHAELGKLVTDGRRQEFRHFAAFSDPQARQRIPDPQAEATFLASKLNWEEAQRDPHASCLRLYRRLLELRRSEAALQDPARRNFAVTALGDDTLLLRRSAAESPTLLVAARLRGEGVIELPVNSGSHGWEVILTTEDAAFSPDPRPPVVECSSNSPRIQFLCPSAVILREQTA